MVTKCKPTFVQKRLDMTTRSKLIMYYYNSVQGQPIITTLMVTLALCGWVERCLFSAIFSICIIVIVSKMGEMRSSEDAEVVMIRVDFIWAIKGLPLLSSMTTDNVVCLTTVINLINSACFCLNGMVSGIIIVFCSERLDRGRAPSFPDGMNENCHFDIPD